MGRGPRLDEEGARGPVATVFVSDPTAEAERAAQALRAGGYAVIDVPLSMLVARVGVQCPRVILVDADSDGALDAVSRVRELPGAGDIHVLFLARPGAAIGSPDEALGHGGNGLFVRPVDVPALVRKVDSLTGGAHSPSPVPAPSSSRDGQDPASLPPSSMRVGLPAPMSAVPLPPQLPRPPGSGVPSDPPPSTGAVSLRKVAALAPPVSSELQQLLAEAELRVQVRADSESAMPSPEDEIEAVLPAELLASLDEPLEPDDDEDDHVAPVRTPAAGHVARDRTNDGGGPRTTGASTTGSGATPPGAPAGTSDNGSSAFPRAPASGDDMGVPLPAYTHGGTRSGTTGSGGSTTGESSTGEVAAEVHPPAGEREGPFRVGGTFPPTFGPGEAISLMARAIAGRVTGSLCFESGQIERRALLREGDVVTSASTGDGESLLAFLGARGELPRETVRRFGSKLPPFGRHAGAALVARGYLRQEQMWPTLRAHAEWVLGRLMAATSGRLTVEAQPPGRLAGEPGVFGGSTGAEVFVELVRRTISPADAVERLGGAGSRIGDGLASQLLGECSLAASEVERVRAAPGRVLRDVLDGNEDGDLATVLFALAQLGVVEVLAVGGGADDEPRQGGRATGPDAIDADAVRARVRARGQLVDDGDYFAVLGVAHEATGYEVRRAFLELRRAFDPSRMLTPEVADLAGEVRKITEVLEEAYEILKDPARRERYRRAIEAVPAGAGD